MNAATARTLREYSFYILPAPVKKKYPAMQAGLYQFLKRWWNEELNHRERACFRRIVYSNGPLPDDIKQAARDCGLIVEWPPPKTQTEKKRKSKEKPKSRRLRRR